MINWVNSINSKEISENENPKKIINIFEKIFEFIEQQKGKGLKILTSKQLLEILQIARA